MRSDIEGDAGGADTGAIDVVFYDGVCGLCHRSVRWLARADRHGRLAYAPLQGDTARRLLARRPDLAREDSVVLARGFGTDRERVVIRSTALLEALEIAGPPGSWLAFPAFLLPRRLRDRLYDLVARRRYRWFGRFDACRLPRGAGGRSLRLLP